MDFSYILLPCNKIKYIHMLSQPQTKVVAGEGVIMSNQRLNDAINKSLKTDVYPMLIRMTSSLAKAHASAEALDGARNTGRVLERAISVDGENVNKLIALRQLVDTTMMEAKLAASQADPEIKLSIEATYDALSGVRDELTRLILVATETTVIR